MSKSKTEIAMFAVAAVGVSALAGYGVYKYISSRNNERLRIKKTTDEMMKALDKTNVYLTDPIGVREKLQRMYEGGTEKLQIVSDFDKTLTKFTVNGLQGCTVHGVLETSKHFPESYREKALALKDKYHPIELSAMSSEEKGPLMEEWWSKAHELIKELNLRKENLPVIIKDANIALRDGVDWLFVKAHEKAVPILILSGGLGDIIKEVINQQSQLYENVEISANYMKYNDQGIMIGFEGKLISSNNKHEMTKDLPFFKRMKNRTNVVVMGDLIQDTDVVSSIHNPDNVLTVGFLNEKVDERLKDYQTAFDIVIVDDHSVETVDLLLMKLFHCK